MIACRSLEKVSLSSLDFSKGQDIIFWIIEALRGSVRINQLWCVQVLSWNSCQLSTWADKY
jgi:hypothetical protein